MPVISHFVAVVVIIMIIINDCYCHWVIITIVQTLLLSKWPTTCDSSFWQRKQSKAPKKKKHALENYLETTCKFPFQQRSLFQVLFHHLETNPCLDSRPATSKIPKRPRTKRFCIHYLNTKCQKKTINNHQFPRPFPPLYITRVFSSNTLL